MYRVIYGFLAVAVIAQANLAQAQNSNRLLFDTIVNQNTAQKSEAKEASVKAVLVPTDKAGVVQLQVHLDIPEGANSYSQDEDFPKPTVIKLNQDGWKEVDSKYRINPPPKREYDAIFDAEVEKIFGKVIFSRRFQVPSGTSVTAATLEGEIEFLLCDNETCTPRKLKFEAKSVPVKKSVTGAEESIELSSADQGMVDRGSAEFIPFEELQFVSTNDESALGVDATAIPEDSATSGRHALANAYEMQPVRNPKSDNPFQDPVKLQFELSPSDAQPGETVTLAVTMTVNENWSTYGLKPADDSQIEIPTSFRFVATNLVEVGETDSVPPPVVKEVVLGDEKVRSNIHYKQVTWKQRFRVEAEGEFGVSGTIRYQICEIGKNCLSPHQVKFALGSDADEQLLAAAVPVSTSYVNVVNPPKNSFVNLDYEGSEEKTTFSGALFGAFIAGLLMNVLPCVLPVLAIKILSFVQQAGDSRARIFALNFTYSAGVIAVFLVLATMSVIIGHSLSVMYQNVPFIIFMICVVFVMALSLFGVFEFPVPGVIPSSAHNQEGYLGAFNTGVIATVIGAPCLAPWVSTTFTYTLGQPAIVTYIMFAAMGIGMAFPFVLTAFFPQLVNSLPRPGMWMVKFKQFTGFVMLGTALFLLFSVPMVWRVPVLFLLLSLALFVWLSANVTSPADAFAKRVRGVGYSLLTSVPIFAFGVYLITISPISAESSTGAHRVVVTDDVVTDDDSDNASAHMPWQPFSEKLVTELRQQGRPMLIDFTANWCVICKVNERVALDRKQTIEFVKKHDIVPIMADFTHENPEILSFLKMFGQESVPLLAIIPPGKDSKVILLRGTYTLNTLTEKLNAAVNVGK